MILILEFRQWLNHLKKTKFSFLWAILWLGVDVTKKLKKTSQNLQLIKIMNNSQKNKVQMMEKWKIQMMEMVNKGANNQNKRFKNLFNIHFMKIQILKTEFLLSNIIISKILRIRFWALLKKMSKFLLFALALFMDAEKIYFTLYLRLHGYKILLAFHF